MVPHGIFNFFGEDRGTNAVSLGMVIDFESKRREAMAAADSPEPDPVLALLEAAMAARGAELAAIADGRFAQAQALNARIRKALELAIDMVD